MSYRDDIGQAHERIAKLEGELREERAKNAQPVVPRRSRALSYGLFIALAGVVIGAAFGFYMVRRPPPSDAILMKPVDDVVRDQSRYRNVRMRVFGDVVRGSFAKQAEPCEVRMVLEKRSVLLTIHLPHCQLPELFRPDTEGMGVTAEGELTSDGTFEATAIALTR